jgi:hypothetical protein
MRKEVIKDKIWLEKGLEINTLNKLMKLSPHYLIRYYSILGAFELGRNL